MFYKKIVKQRFLFCCNLKNCMHRDSKLLAIVKNNNKTITCFYFPDTLI